MENPTPRALAYQVKNPLKNNLYDTTAGGYGTASANPQKTVNRVLKSDRHDDVLCHD